MINSKQIYCQSSILNKREESSKYAFFGGILFFSMVSLPFELFYVKAILISVILLYFLVRIRHIKINMFVFVWFIFYISWGYFYLLLGSYYENQGVTSLLGVFLVWPVVYLLFISLIYKQIVLDKLIFTLLYSSLFISIYTLLFVFLENINLIDSSNFPLIRRSYDLDFPDKIEVFSAFVTSLMFLIPFNIAILINFNRQFFIKRKVSMYLFLGLNILAAYFASRNALFLVILLSPVIVYFIGKMIDRKPFSFKIRKSFLKTVVLLTVLMPFIAIAFSTQLMLIIDNFILGFNFTSTEALSAYARFQQFFELFNAWKEYPFFGSGLGATIDGYYRNDEMPWMFELSYLYQLYATGLFGVFFYIFLIFFMFKKCISIARENEYYRTITIAILTGTISFLIANATNPYLYSFEHMWALFAPLAIINVHSYNNKKVS